MQKSWIVFVLLGIMGSNAQVINIPDPNFKAVLLAADVTNSIAYDCTQFSYYKIDSNSNGEIEQNEAIAVCQLNIMSSNISDLQGIEYFTNLKILACSQNLINSIDLSQLTNLQTLTCDNNYITSLNLGSLIGLKILTCKNNQITALDFSQNPLLERVYCNQNLLTSLDFGANPIFFELGCANNPNLSEINLKNGVAQQFPPNTIYNECWTGCPSLSRICADSFELSALQTYLSDCGIATSGMVISSNCTLGEEEMVRDTFKVFPNPNNGSFTITTQQENDIAIYDVVGQLVFENKKALQTLVTNLKQGLYFVKIEQQNTTVKIVKIVVE